MYSNEAVSYTHLDRRKMVDTVLLPMMVFVHVNPKERMEVLSFSTVSRYMVMRGERDVYKRQQVTLITGPVQLKTQHSGIIRVDVESAEERYKAAQAHTCV